MSATRSEAIRNHLDQLSKIRTSVNKFPIIISQDGDTRGVTDAIRDYVNETTRISFIHVLFVITLIHRFFKHKERVGASSASQKSAKNYFYIAQHYKWALDKVFKEMGYKTVIITEGKSTITRIINIWLDDLDIAEDFFSYFSSTKHLLYEDPTIWCISAFNDNGAPSLADRKKSQLLYRTDFFPGLGTNVEYLKSFRMDANIENMGRTHSAVARSVLGRLVASAGDPQRPRLCSARDLSHIT